MKNISQTNENYKILRIYTDGGSRGNPGPSASAFLVVDENDYIIKEQSEYLGKNTNNVAEYVAMIRALEFTLKLKPQKVICYSDSQLMIRQILGQYKVKAPHLIEFHAKIIELKNKFKNIEFENVRRSDKMVPFADKLVNDCLDLNQYKKN
jgi:ribonuclease HI